MPSDIIGMHYHTWNHQMQSLYKTPKYSKEDSNLINDKYLIQKTP